MTEHTKAPGDMPPRPPAGALRDGAAFRAWLDSLGPPPKEGGLYRDLNWDAPWTEVVMRVELPFWLQVQTSLVTVDINGHNFPVNIENETCELHAALISDSKETVLYRDPIRKPDELSPQIQELLKRRPTSTLWRKCKTVLKITSRCNEDVRNKAHTEGRPPRPSVKFYLENLCRAHLPGVNKLIQGYRLACYDPFAFEVAPWDVPNWMIEFDTFAMSFLIVPYRGWDVRPTILPFEGPPKTVNLTNQQNLQAAISSTPSPGEFELLDAINLNERGNYSDAVRRITTALEVIVESVTGKEVERSGGREMAQQFLERTRTNFLARVRKYEQLSARKFPNHARLKHTRDLRHRIVHEGYRIVPGAHSDALRAVDTGRWMFNWFENDPERTAIRERHILERSMGRDMSWGAAKSEVTSDGVVLTPWSHKAETLKGSRRRLLTTLQAPRLRLLSMLHGPSAP